MQKKTLTTTALARLTGVHRNTIRNYAESGILSPTVLSDRTRVFEPDDVARVREIIAARIAPGRKRKAM